MVIVDLQAGQCLFCTSRSRRWLNHLSNGGVLKLALCLSRTRGGGDRRISFQRQTVKIDEKVVASKGNSEFRGFKWRPRKDDQKLSTRQSTGKSHLRLNTLEPLTLKPRSGKNAELIPIIFERLRRLSNEPKGSPFLDSFSLEEDLLRERLNDFEQKTTHSFYGWATPGWKTPPMLELLRQTYIDNGRAGLDAQLKFAFHGYVANYGFNKSDIQNQAKLADLRYPTEWYPATRVLQRTIHLHVGPTNSGKTYHALKRLEQAESGVYAGPLRLLAHEVYSRLNAKGKRCNLVTGDERVMDLEQANYLTSCTVEMVPINVDVEVAVVDEIQMIGNMDRGWAWTQAVLGLKAKELHLCGEDRAVPLVRELAAAMGDKLEIHRYERLSPLRTMSTSLEGDLRKLRKGDCVVSFSRMGIHALKKEIEKITKKRVAVVYGSLPPEIRAQQAKLFNDPDNDYDILVASDAIGMGLNLSIKRIVFESTSKHNGVAFQPIAVSEIKQIAGRAGRYRTAQDDVRDQANLADSDQRTTTIALTPAPAKNLGLVTSLEKIDLPIIKRAMQIEAQPLLTAGIFPPASIVTRFATYFSPETPFSYILLRLHELARMHQRFHLCALRDQIGIADAIQSIKGLTINDRLCFCAAPAAIRDPGVPSTLEAFAKRVANQSGGGLLDIPELQLEVLDWEVTADRQYLRQLESLHKSIVLYLWLSYRFTGVFTSRAMASHVKGLVEQKIDMVLAKFSTSAELRERVKMLREQSILRQFKTQIETEGVEVTSVDSEVMDPEAEMQEEREIAIAA